jgi:outer membrane protein assembly factor BamB
MNDSGVANPAGWPTSVASYLVDTAHRNAVADSTLIPPLERKWTRSLGSTVSYPLVVNGIVYVTTAGSHTVDPTLYALDQMTGTTLWSADLGAVTTASIAYDQGRIFELDELNAGVQGYLRAYDAVSGSVIWSTALDPNQAFYDAPPAAYRGLVYVYGEGTGGTVYAYDEGGGALTWRALTYDGSEGAPVVSDDGVFVTDGCQEVYGFDRLTGERNWLDRGPCEGGETTTSTLLGTQLFVRDPIDGNEIVDVSSGGKLGTFAADLPAAFGPNGAYLVSSGVLHASDQRLATAAWSFAADSNDVSMVPLVVGNFVYTGSSIGTLYALDSVTGAVLWSENTGAPLVFQEGFTSLTPRVGLAAAQGSLIVPSGAYLFAYRSAPPDAGAGVTGSSCTFSLENAPALPTPVPPLPTADVAVADMDGDGKLDLVAARAYDTGSVGVFLGNGEGAFRSLGDVPLATEADALAVGDFNDDGHPDAVVINTYGESSGGPGGNVLLNAGTGGLLAPSRFDTGTYPTSVATADLNGDGHLDLLIMTGLGVGVFLGKGDGTFKAPVYYEGYDASEIEPTPTLGDVNGDGKLDIVVPDVTTIDLLLGQGDGTFAAAISIPTQSQAELASVGDVNGDGKADLVATSGFAQSGTVTVLLGHGDGTFGTPAVYAAGVEASAVAMADMNGDGAVDVVVANAGSGSISVLLGNGDGTFQNQLAFSTTGAPGDFRIADLNGDGHPDLAIVTNSSDGVEVLLGQCPGPSPSPPYVKKPKTRPGREASRLTPAHEPSAPRARVRQQDTGDEQKSRARELEQTERIRQPCAPHRTCLAGCDEHSMPPGMPRGGDALTQTPVSGEMAVP